MKYYRFEFEKPELSDLQFYGYTEADGEPKIGQQFTVNAYAELYWGDDCWPGSSPCLGARVQIAWHAVDKEIRDRPDQLSRLSHFEITVWGRGCPLLPHSSSILALSNS
jgi:hypothetical protein